MNISGADLEKQRGLTQAMRQMGGGKTAPVDGLGNLSFGQKAGGAPRRGGSNRMGAGAASAINGYKGKLLTGDLPINDQP